MHIGFYDWCHEFQGNIANMKPFLSESYFLCKVGGEVIDGYEGSGDVGDYQRFGET